MQIVELQYTEFEQWRSEISTLLTISVETNFPSNTIDEGYYSEKCDELKNYLSEGKAVVFLAIHNEDLVGLIWICENYRFDELRLHVVHFAVTPQWKKKGVGRQLLSEVEDYAAKQGVLAIDLMVSACNDDAVSFYEKKEFSVERYLLKKRIAKK